MKICIITGGANGIGYDLAEKFYEKNYKVIVLDLEKTNNKDVDFIKTDLSKPEEIETAFYLIKEKYGSAHVLINNGAISHFEKNILDVNLNDVDRVIDTNLKGAFLCAKEFIKINKEEDYGRIINISSTRFHQNEANWELYGLTKGGLVSLTNSLCISLSKTNITVNCISPGYIETGDYNEIEKKYHDMHPSRRVGKPRDISNACLFLADEENDFINGANLIIDGGMTKKMIY